MLSNHKADTQIRNPWWCGGPVSKSMSKENEFWNYKWLNDLTSTIIDRVSSLLSSINKNENMVHKKRIIRNLCLLKLIKD